MRKCEICGFETENSKTYSNHIRWQHLMKDRNSAVFKNYRAKVSEKRKAAGNLREELHEDCLCPECGKQFTKTLFRNSTTGKIRVLSNYCSKTCASKQGPKFIDYKHISDIRRQNPVGFAAPGYSAKESARKNHSKGELEIVHYFKENFKDDDWRVGLIDGSKRHNGILLNPDLWSKKLKVVIEYDGIWHFANIHNQLEHKQLVDKETLKFCKENGYRLIRVDEDCKIPLQKIVDVVYKGNQDVEIFNSERYSYLFE